MHARVELAVLYHLGGGEWGQEVCFRDPAPKASSEEGLCVDRWRAVPVFDGVSLEGAFEGRCWGPIGGRAFGR